MNIGRYEVVEQLGKGGMASVYLAHDPYIKRQVAVKLLSSRYTHTPEFRVRFQREAEVIASLEHAHIVPVYDFGEHEEQPFIVMRYLPGGTLADRLSQGALSVPEIIPLFQSIASALDYAHENGVVHRDIKPGNILFDSQGEAHLSDFGIAKIQEATAAFTGTGNLIGTPAYISPEQAKGEKTVDGRSDIYSLGVVLFHALSGRLPFESDTPMGVAVSHIKDPVPSLLALRPDLPPGFEGIIRKALDKDPAKRYQSATEFADAIRDQAKPFDRDHGTVIESISETLVEGLPETIVSHSRPVIRSIPAQPNVEAVPTLPPQYASGPSPKRSIFPRLMGVGGALLVLLLCFGLIGRVATGLLPNPFASGTVTEAAGGIDAETPEGLVPTSTLDENEGLAPTPTSSPKSLLPEIADGTGTLMVLVPAGEFSMGGSDMNAEPDEKPVHTVYLDDYYIDKFEVTNAAYQTCVDAGLCKAPIQTDSFTRSDYYGDPEYDDYPVVYVDWNMANAYCKWRGTRLPSEAEWEKAARGWEDERFYPWGTGNIDCQTANYYGPNGCYGSTTRAGSYEAGTSPFGVYDMAGNVWEWVADWYSESYYQTSPANDPAGPDSGQSRVLRGGSWNRREYDVRVPNRNKYGPTYYNFDIGFRCAIEAAP